MAQAIERGVDLELPLTDLITYSQLSIGDRIHILGKARERCGSEDDGHQVGLYVQRRQETVCFSLRASVGDECLDQLQDVWCCVFSSLATPKENSVEISHLDIASLSSRHDSLDNPTDVVDHVSVVENQASSGTTTDTGDHVLLENDVITKPRNAKSCRAKRLVDQPLARQKQRRSKKIIKTKPPAKKQSQNPPAKKQSQNPPVQDASVDVTDCRGYEQDSNLEGESHEQGEGHVTDGSLGDFDMNLKPGGSTVESSGLLDQCLDVAGIDSDAVNLDLELLDVKRKRKRRRPGNNHDVELYRLNKEAILSLEGKSEDSVVRHECLICGEEFSHVCNLPRHVERYHCISVEEYKKFLKCSASERHEMILAFWQMPLPGKYDNVGEEMTCDFCGVSLPGMLTMRHHLKVCHLDEVGLTDKIQEYGEKLAGIMFRNKREGAGDKRNRHPCRYCGLMLSFVCSRSRHENYYCEMNPDRRKLSCCPRCHKVFATRDEMESHKLTHRTDEFKFVCDLCGKVRHTKAGLYQHRMKDHSNQGTRYSCSICQKAFYAKDKYNRHLTVHNDARPFVCEVCGKQFKTKQSVTKHQRSVHNNRYPHHCKKCGHGVEKLQYLNTHRCGRVRRTQMVSVPNPPTTVSDTQDESETGAALSLMHVADSSMLQLQASEIDGQFMTGDDLLKSYPDDKTVVPPYVLPSMPTLVNCEQLGYQEVQTVTLPQEQPPLSLQPIQQTSTQQYTIPVNMSLPQYQRINYIPLYYDQTSDTSKQQSDEVTNVMPPDSGGGTETISFNTETGLQYNKLLDQVNQY